MPEVLGVTPVARRAVLCHLAERCTLSNPCSSQRKKQLVLRASAAKSHFLFQTGRVALLTVPCRQSGERETSGPSLGSGSLVKWSDPRSTQLSPADSPSLVARSSEAR